MNKQTHPENVGFGHRRRWDGKIVESCGIPKTHKMCDKNIFFGIQFGDFGEIWWNYIYSAKQRHVASPSRCNFGI